MIQRATVRVVGYIPSKKNLYAAGKGRIYLPREVRQVLDGLQWQMMKQWRGRQPLKHPNMTFNIFVTADRQDKDNIETTLIDCMVKAGILVDDNIKNNNGHKHSPPAVVVKEGEPGAIINLTWGSDDDEDPDAS